MFFEKYHIFCLTNSSHFIMENEKVLELAEKIISALGDGSIYEKYLKLKQKIISSSSISELSLTNSLENHLKKIALENRELASRIEMISSAVKSDSLSDYIITQLCELQAKVLPDVSPRYQHTVQEAAANLLQILNAKNKSNTYFRNSFTKKNNQIEQSINDIESKLNHEIETINNKLISSTKNYKSKEEAANSHLNSIEEEFQHLSRTLEATELENEKLENEVDYSKQDAKERLKILTEVTKKRDITVTRLNELKKKANLLKFEVEAKSKDVEKKRALQVYGLDSDTKELEIIRNLEEEIAFLMIENEKLSLDVKRMRLTPVIIESEISSFSSLFV